jgi:hypothetical protein
MQFKESTKLDKLSFFITIILTGFLLIATSYLLYQLLNKQAIFNNELWVVLLVDLTFFITWGLHPSGYIIRSNAIEIIRPFKSIKIRKEEIESISDIDTNQIGLGLRTFGSGGLFGYFGWYSSKKIGRHLRYTTNSNHLALIKLKSGLKILISPSSSSFVATARDTIKL